MSSSVCRPSGMSVRNIWKSSSKLGCLDVPFWDVFDSVAIVNR